MPSSYGLHLVHVDSRIPERDPPLEELARAALGPSGNLRAPAARMGKSWLVGFGEDAWSGHFD